MSLTEPFGKDKPLPIYRLMSDWKRLLVVLSEANEYISLVILIAVIMILKLVPSEVGIPRNLDV